MMRQSDFFQKEFVVDLSSSSYKDESAKDMVEQACREIVDKAHTSARFVVQWMTRGGPESLSPVDYMPIIEMLVAGHPLKSLAFTCSAGRSQAAVMAYIRENIVPLIEVEPCELQTVRVNGEVAWQNPATPAAAASAASMRSVDMCAGR